MPSVVFHSVYNLYFDRPFDTRESGKNSCINYETLHYYHPLENRIEILRRKYASDEKALRVIEDVQTEINF